MMKTLCIAVVVLSITSVCQAASLACEQLLKPVDKDPDISGRWYLIAMSSNTCFFQGFMNAFLWPSFAVDITATDTSNIYNATLRFGMLGICDDTSSLLYGNGTIFDTDDSKEDLLVLLQSGCPDCLVMKGGDDYSILLLMSRRKNVTAAEMKEFESQTNCIGGYKPEVLNTYNDFENCTLEDDLDLDNPEIWSMVSQRLNKMLHHCFTDELNSYYSIVRDWAQNTWNNLW
ncbi:uncharacterized protein LOC130181871 [Seriola aureovittata]|uniref:uncharacterized protein LOC130181871 n=1 Tax=Seriola aureovittata TaxID=2871759 RepID=UPI0024BDF32F|nr:uncharacterized protein LOC130181871 [Seriola aureovittata]